MKQWSKKRQTKILFGSKTRTAPKPVKWPRSHRVVDCRPNPHRLVTKEKLDHFFRPRTEKARLRAQAREENDKGEQEWDDPYACHDFTQDWEGPDDERITEAETLSPEIEPRGKAGNAWNPVKAIGEARTGQAASSRNAVTIRPRPLSPNTARLDAAAANGHNVLHKKKANRGNRVTGQTDRQTDRGGQMGGRVVNLETWGAAGGTSGKKLAAAGWCTYEARHGRRYRACTPQENGEAPAETKNKKKSKKRKRLQRHPGAAAAACRGKESRQLKLHVSGTSTNNGGLKARRIKEHKSDRAVESTRTNTNRGECVEILSSDDEEAVWSEKRKETVAEREEEKSVESRRRPSTPPEMVLLDSDDDVFQDGGSWV